MKTVYVLGAGFSIDAGAPPQEKLVQKIFELHENDPQAFNVKRFEAFVKLLEDVCKFPKACTKIYR